jgi:hypothetical protein
MFGDASIYVNVPWSQHLMNNLSVLVVLFIFDKIFLENILPIHKQRDKVSARWFFCHAFANLGVVITGFPAVIACIKDPFNVMNVAVHSDTSMFGSGSVWPLTIINSIHIYHMIGGFGLSSSDYFHHIMFIPTLGFPGQIFAFGAGANWQGFFISGLPGGIDYFMLGLIKLGISDKMFQKRLSSNLNVWVRSPGILSATFILYQSVIYGLVSAPWWTIILQLLLPPYNALYYSKQSVANYSVHYMLDRLGQGSLLNGLKQRVSVTIGSEIMDWDHAVAHVLPKKDIQHVARGGS